ncbi:HD domain-containing phosphohydrolase [Desulfogranum mediterraneum]|uniref:HD domain-containing phosphohydrolase n=1 Tax=Desulfogranum mediterraneum TaxID=160661 RepID=UPI000410BBBA|nr:HD domain-containing phosphohydrolase [Desulfogranum mediterraneum]
MRLFPRPASVRLHLVIASLFVGLITLFGSGLAWYNYQATSRLLVSAANEMFSQISRELSLDYLGSYKPVATAVIVVSATGVVHAVDLEERLRYLPMFQAALQEAPHLSGLQVGYGDGGYFIVRPLSRDYLRSRFDAPPGAALVVDQVELEADGKRYLRRFWFSEGLEEVGRAAPEETGYDPRLRPWYTQAIAESRVIGTAPYLFRFIGRLGFTVARRSPLSRAVVAGDVTLMQLSETLASHRITRRSELALLSEQGQVVAYHDGSRLVRRVKGQEPQLSSLRELDSGVLSYVAETVPFRDGVVDFRYKGESWLGAVRELDNLLKESGYFLVMLSPKRELLAQAVTIQLRAALIALVLILAAVVLTWLLARRIATSLQGLVEAAERVSRFDFSTAVSNGTPIREVQELSRAMGMMQATIGQFTRLIDSLAGEGDFDALLATVTAETMQICGADAAVAYLVDESTDRLTPAVVKSRRLQGLEVAGLGEVPVAAGSPLARALLSGTMEEIRVTARDGAGFADLLQLLGHEALTLSVIPLHNRSGEAVGVLVMIHEQAHAAVGPGAVDYSSFVEAISGFAAVTLESRKMLKMQKQLLESFIQVLAGAIDAKSPYTGGHCQRVPVLVKMLARKACESREGSFADFRLDGQQWEALHIAAWLHDCGKVTTPEYVVDKATKLETIYDRIHEVRMRFEVLKRDAQLAYWQELYQGGEQGLLERQLERQWQRLDEEFAFVARCNLGGEWLSSEHLERLTRIGARTWQRTIDDCQGLGWEELERLQAVSSGELPVTEFLLADKEEHLIPRSGSAQAEQGGAHGFCLETPKYLYNRGELYNLSVRRGTLSPEERYQINDHIVQTIIMLDKLPYPRHLQAVPEIAGGHHEKMDGSGYPRGLKGAELSLPARMMVIADVFEALTASDRPYKKAKTLAQALAIMEVMVQEHHLDGELFALFVSSGACLEYALEYLLPEQLAGFELDCQRGGD